MEDNKLRLFEPILVQQDWRRAKGRDWSEVLAGFPLFSELGSRQLRKIVRQARFAEFEPGEAVVLTGDPGDSFYVVLGGRAEVGGKPDALVLGPGDYFGEGSLLSGEPRSATVVAAGELHVMRLPGRVFLELVEENPGVALTILKDLGNRIRRAERRPAPSFT